MKPNVKEAVPSRKIYCTLIIVISSIVHCDGSTKSYSQNFSIGPVCSSTSLSTTQYLYSTWFVWLAFSLTGQIRHNLKVMIQAQGAGEIHSSFILPWPFRVKEKFTILRLHLAIILIIEPFPFF